MSDLTPKPNTWQQVKAWSKKSSEEKLHYVLLLIIAALLVSSTGSWFLGHLALAAIVAKPTVKWFFGKDRSKWSPKLWIMRGSLAAFTLGFFIYGWIADGFSDGVLYAGLIFLLTGFGWVKREKMLASLIFLSFVVLSEFGTVACFTAAILIAAGMLHMQWKTDAANKKARRESLFDERDLSERHPRTHLGTTGGGLADRTGYGDLHTGPYAGQSDRPAPQGDGRRQEPEAAYDQTVFGMSGSPQRDVDRDQTGTFQVSGTDQDFPRNRRRVEGDDRPLQG